MHEEITETILSSYVFKLLITLFSVTRYLTLPTLVIGNSLQTLAKPWPSSSVD